ncbi:rhomboid family [Micractinium conductrix]|uniref:Rhomboid family n=1 Tax=Micractinium conductrix TaxID=554055 RepID=A0A2P6V6P8_9CHLO|nr:rhomboid family [Micractinium conductrix]|eukprot:PSC69748.1 rhomboid family [Micractinium conductrix]
MGSEGVLVEALQQPATTAIALLLLAVYLLLHQRHLSYADVGLSYDRVVTHRELWRCAACQVAHLDFIHLAFNLSTLWSLGLVKRTSGLGPGYFLHTTVLLFLLCPAICVLLYHVLIVALKREQYRDVTAVGYSCVLFGWMTLLATRQPGGITMLPLFGLASVPMWLTPWASLLITSLLVPKASFIGHLAGILAGYAAAFGLLSWLSPYWTVSLVAWAALLTGHAAARTQQLTIPYIRLPAAAAGLRLLGGGGSSSSGGGGDVESGGGGAPPAAKM